MALPMLRGSHRFSSTLSLSRLFLNDSVLLSGPARTRVSPPTHAAVTAAARTYSSGQGKQKMQRKIVFVGLPNPIIWVRTRIYYFLIRAYFDKDFNIKEFTEGAKQAFSHVSRLLSQCRFEALEGLVAKDLIGKLEEKCNLLPPSSKKALSAEPDQIMYTAPADVAIYFDDNGRRFVSILMRFWYLTNANISDNNMEGTPVFQVAIGGEGKAGTQRLLSAHYEFQREFTEGVAPDWTIMKIEHSKLLD